MRQADPKLRALMVSGCVDEALVRRALQSGASGFVEKGAPLDELRKAMQTVMAGERYISHEMSSRLALLSVDNAGRPSAESLSNREFLVLRQLGTGKTVSEVAAELCRSVKTVSTYRTRLLRKLNLHSTAELVRYAIKGGWA